MPGKIKVKVLAGRNLPVMDRASDTTDAFVEIKFGGVTHKTDVCRKSLNPHWNSTEWYRFEVDESELQDEPLQLRLMDHDTYSANDAIGKVVISLAPLLAREAIHSKGTAAPQGGSVLSGWIPVFDTMHGIRGELNVIVKVELFSDFNKYKTSSCGVQFFHCPKIPPGYRATAIHGFVEELVVNDDPEYQWIDKIRTPRASNEARQVAFIKLSNQVQRLVGLKAAELGANAVVGYQQDFDLEGEAGVVARAIGTAVSIVPLPTPTQSVSIPPCTQLQLRKYLDILTTDNDNITDLNEYYQTHQDELLKMLSILHPNTSSNIDDPENDENDDNDDDARSVGLIRQTSIKSYTGDFSIYQDEYASHKSLRDISKDQTDLNKLLHRNEEYDSDSSGPLNKIKKIKTNFFTKRLASIRSRRSSKSVQDDQVSLKSNNSDTSRLSVVEIGKERLKRLKKPKFRKTFVNKDDEGEGMASILARSVIHAHTSLACIAESQDSEHSPQSNRRTSESEPTINITDEDNVKEGPQYSSEQKSHAQDKRDAPEIHFTSLNNVNKDYDHSMESHRKLSESCPSTPIAGRSDNLLKLPGEVGYFGSVSSALSGESSEMYSSSEEDDESSDLKTDTERSYETTSSVVQTVLSHDVDPIFIAQMERKLTTLELSTSESNSKGSRNVDDNENDDKKFSHSQEATNRNDDQKKNADVEPSTSTAMESTSVINKSNHHFKIHNPFSHKKVCKSSSVPSSPKEKKNFVYRSSDRIKRHLSKISNSNMIKSLSHISLIPKKKHVVTKPALSQPSSASDVSLKGHSKETVLGSPFLSYTDLFNLDKDGMEASKQHHRSDEFSQSKVSMYIGSEPESRASLSSPSSPGFVKDIHFDDHKSHRKDKILLKPTGLVHTAMETILIDKVQSLLIPTSPNSQSKEQKFFEDVNEKLEQVNQEARNSDSVKDNTILSSKPSSLVNTAMETMLLEKVQSLLIPASPESQTKDINFFNDTNDTSKQTPTCQANVVKPSTDDTDNRQSSSLLHTAMEAMLIDKVQSLFVPTSTDSPTEERKKLSCIPEKSKKLVRQDSVRSETDESCKMSKEISNITVPRVTRNTPVLQHFHPILSGAPRLETIPSEDSVERSQSLDVQGVCVCQNECSCHRCGINSASVCGNSHAGWNVNRSESKADKGDKGSPRHARHESYGGRDPGNTPQAQSSLNTSSIPMQGIHRRSSDSDLSITPKGNSLNASIGNTGSGGGAILRPSMNSNNIEMLEYPFLTMNEYPPGFITHLGGTVCSRSVKLADGGGAESGVRAAWWAELRTELRAHARALRCNAVIAYRETAAICEDVCVLSASGTAAVINLENDFNDNDVSISASSELNDPESCLMAHVPYSPGAGPYRAELSICGGCRRARVPAVLLATCVKPNKLLSYGKAITLTAVAARVRRTPSGGEPAARDISDQLPFLEYELHKLLLAKLRMQGANALFSLQTQVAVGERFVMALASGTALRLAALPPPAPPTIKATDKDKEAMEIQKSLLDSFAANKVANGYDLVTEYSTNGILPEVDNEEAPVLDLCADKEACILELDESEDVETARALALRRAHVSVTSQASLAAPGATPHAFVQVLRGRVAGIGGPGAAAERHMRRAIDAVTYKLRRLQPAALAPPCFQLDLPEDEIQLVVSGTAIRLKDPSKVEPNGNIGAAAGPHGGGDTDDDIFTLDEEQLSKLTVSDNEDKIVPPTGQAPTTVSVTSLCSTGGGSTAAGRRVCALRLLFVRETTAVRELGGLSGFLHTFTCEVLAIVRAYTAALGGNALTSFYITQLMLQDNAHKNQGQCLLSVGGDVVQTSY